VVIDLKLTSIPQKLKYVRFRAIAAAFFSVNHDRKVIEALLCA
jgi:hypothetical protein